MKNIFLILILAILIGCQEKTSEKEGKGNIVFSDSLQEAHLQNRQDESSWDYDLFNSDLKGVSDKKSEPFSFGIFPTPKYNLVGKGSFTGLGNFAYTGSGEYVKRIEDKTILFNSFFIKKNKLNEKRLNNKKDDIFFQIIVLTDSIDSVNFTHFNSMVISRNHPDYIGQGYYKTKNNIVEYTAFITADQNSYAIINTRLFDLKFGKTILIAPQKDNSLRSMQIKSPILSSEEIDSYTDNLLKERKVIDFFTNKGAI